MGFDFQIEYVRTENFGQADALSRLVEEARANSLDPDLEEVLASLEAGAEGDLEELVAAALAAYEVRASVLKETQQDPVLQQVTLRLQNGWSAKDKTRRFVRMPFFKRISASPRCSFS